MAVEAARAPSMLGVAKRLAEMAALRMRREPEQSDHFVGGDLYVLGHRLPLPAHRQPLLIATRRGEGRGEGQTLAPAPVAAP